MAADERIKSCREATWSGKHFRRWFKVIINGSKTNMAVDEGMELEEEEFVRTEF